MSNLAPDKSAPPHRYCHNCYYPLPRYGDYCNHCGQKHGPNRVKLGALVRETMESAINFDSRFLRTIWHLIVPGKLTEAYFWGQRQRYLPPVRIFFLTAVLHFAMISIALQEGLTDGLNEANTNEQAYRTVFLEDMRRQSDTLIATITPSQPAQILVDSLYAKLHADQSDSLNSSLPYYDHKLDFRQYSVALSDIKEMSSDSLLDYYEVHGFWNRLVVQQWLKINFEGESFSQGVLGNLIWMVILMMPALALILKLLYIRRRRYFVEHLVFSYHYHAFAFLVFSILVLLLGRAEFSSESSGSDELSGYEATLISMSFLITWLYQYQAMRRVYKQGWFRTLMKSSALNFFYLFIFVFFLLATFAVVALTF